MAGSGKRYRSKRKWHELDLLCKAGIGVGPLAPAICRTLRELVGADAASFFWLDEDAMPAGIFHENAAESALELFVNEYDRLFTGDGETNVSQVAAAKGSPVGFLMAPDRAYFRSNTFNLLVKASGHHHTLDLRVDVGTQARAVVMLFREEAYPFEDADAFYLAQALPYLRRLFEVPANDGPWERTDQVGHLLVNQPGTVLLKQTEAATTLLKACTIVGQNVRLVGSTSLAPLFAQELCRRLESTVIVKDYLTVPLGRLLMTATRMLGPRADAAPDVLIAIELERPTRLRLVENILDLHLSPLQRSIAMVAATGGSRADSLTATGISNESLKKHVSAIYRATGVASWEDLAKTLQ